mgnify:CR=1 FL=1
MTLAAICILGASYFKENFIADIVDSINAPNDEYDGFLPFVMAEEDETAEVVPTVWKNKTYPNYDMMKRQNGFVEEFFEDLQCHR